MNNQQDKVEAMMVDDSMRTPLNERGVYKARVDFSVRLLQFFFRFVGQVFPAIAGALAYKLWFATRRYATPKREVKWQTSARTYTLPHTYGPLMMYVWGEDRPDASKIVLLHGWNGRATQMGPFIEVLLQAGFQVTAFDAPAHGQTPGNNTNILQVADALRSVVNSLGNVDAVVAHSFGAMALTYALREGLNIKKAVCISSPADVSLLVDSFCTSLQIPRRTRKNLLLRFYRNFGDDIWRRFSSVENAKNLLVPALIVHDENDKEVEISHSIQCAEAWPDAQLLVTQGLGHRRILRHPQVLNAVASFVANENL
ncbi:MAG: alpha/beta fold hydrolase [Thiohalomonadales bacterium]